MPGEIHKIAAFGGMAPAVDPTLLPEQSAELAVNAWLDLGTLIGFPEPKLVYTSNLDLVGYVYRIPTNYNAPDDMIDSFYMCFSNPDTSVIRGNVFGDTHDRYYWASTDGPPQYLTKDLILAEHAPYLLGVTVPVGAPAVTASGGTAPSPTVTRAYTYTWVTEFGEESAPAPPTVVTDKVDATWHLVIPSPAPPDVAGPDRVIEKTRIYRTITGASGIATFFLVDEIPVATTTYDDTKLDQEISGNQLLESMTWTPPPDDLQGLVVGPNGIVAGWRANEVWFSEPYRPHAWPVQNVVTTEYQVVGMGVINQTFVVLTLGYPVTITGTDPQNMGIARLPVFEPCTSRGSIVSAPEGVYYSSGNGLMLVQLGAVTNITRSVVTKERWQSYTRDARFRAGRLGSAYVGFGTIQIGVFQANAFQTDAFQQSDHTGARNGIYFDPTNQRISLVLLTSEQDVNNVLNDPWTTELLFLKENKVYWEDLADESQERQIASWTSKEFQTMRARSYGAVKIYFKDPGTHWLPSRPVRDTSQDQVLEKFDSKFGIVRFYGDGRSLNVYEIRKSGELMRLNSASKYDFLTFEIDTRVEIKSVVLATTAKDLVNA